MDGAFQDKSRGNFPLKITPKYDTKNHCPHISYCYDWNGRVFIVKRQYAEDAVGDFFPH